LRKKRTEDLQKQKKTATKWKYVVETIDGPGVKLKALVKS